MGLLWQSMFSVDIKDIKLVHLDLPSHPSHNAKHWPFEPDHEQSRSPTCISKILVLLTRITNIPDLRLSSGPLYGKVKRTHWDEEAISLISATS